MISESSIEIVAPADAVWTVYADVERWHEWTASIERVTPRDGPDLAVGKRFEIDQPRLPKLVWEVTEVMPGRSWSWEQRSPGGRTRADHEVVPLAADRTLVRQRIDQQGPAGVVVGLLMRRLTRRYLEMEARGLKARVEQTQPSDAAPA